MSFKKKQMSATTVEGLKVRLKVRRRERKIEIKGFLGTAFVMR